jgi:hypothetical protein
VEFKSPAVSAPIFHGRRFSPASKVEQPFLPTRLGQAGKSSHFTVVWAAGTGDGWIVCHAAADWGSWQTCFPESSPWRIAAVAETSIGMPVLVELESRQDEVLRQLEDLQQRVERTLADFLAIRCQAEAPASN